MRCFKWSFLACALLMLGGCGGGGGGAPAPVVSPPTTPTVPPTAQSLLTDAQLRTNDDPRQALAAMDAVSWFAQNAQIIRSLVVDDDFSDLSFLDVPLRDKKLVMLGESSHGAKEYSLAKVRLIKYLHETQGFNVLAFEAGLFDCENAQRLLELGDAPAAMDSCLSGVWRTQALRELFAYVAATHNTATPLRVTGFDVQASGRNFARRADHTAAMIAKVSADYAQDVLDLERDYVQVTAAARTATDAADDAQTTLNARLTRYQNDYAALADFLVANTGQIVADGDVHERDVMIAAQYARTSPLYAEQLSERFAFESGSRARDLGMARNLLALSQTIYPDDRVIGWAHNAHLRHRGTGFLPDANMGSLVHAELAATMYTIGFYMYRGQHAFNDRSVRDVNAPLDSSLEAVFYSRRLAYLFVDLTGNAMDDPGSSWLEQPTPTWAWGSAKIDLVLRREYDGLVIIDRVSPPNYL